MDQPLPTPADDTAEPDPAAEAADATTPDDEPTAKAVLARLNPALTDSPLRRHLRAAGLEAPFGIDTTPPPAPPTQET
ncbi:hypothetical protein [Actinacidiphila acididurans]|uniref:Uncharacterized protein n=1 Tax=Actinacidiphila acididurans TaxID=2784346 RepID=A0ABS2U4P2_9ACTN|nr:hypothetical protein [Actinacidiphila acididurans]MBM9509962.1 hypothetical protein [Actinacidiphila acididurans]